MSLLKACNETLTHFEKSCALSGSRMKFARKEITTQLNTLLTADGLLGMLERRGCYPVDTVFPFVAPFTERSICFQRNCDLLDKMCSRMKF